MSTPAAAAKVRLPGVGRQVSLFAPVDVSSLVFFRILFGAIMLWTVWDFYSKDRIASFYIEPVFHFTYHGFEWLQPWPGQGMYIHFAALAVLALLVMVGFLYRLSAVLLFLGFTYVFLLEKAVFLNHYYLMCLICLLLIFLPAQRAWSVDGLLRPGLRSETVPAWTLWLLRFQIGLPYFYGGLMKLNSDWLQGQPMQMWLARSDWRGLLGATAAEHWLALLVSWGGLLFDLSIVPLLLWRRTRVFGFVIAVLFHLQNAFMFDIGVFPWLMIGATTVFFAPDWPRRLLENREKAYASRRVHPGGVPKDGGDKPRRSPYIVALLGLYVAFHLLFPFRHLLYPGSVMWTEEGYHFSWQMMLWQKVNAVRFVVIDRATGQGLPVDFAKYMNAYQVERMGHDPEMLREFAEFLREEHAAQGRDVAIHVTALCSLNGRKPQPLIDPRVDLSRQPRTLFAQPYIIPLREPFRRHPWNISVKEWEKRLADPPDR